MLSFHDWGEWWQASPASRPLGGKESMTVLWLSPDPPSLSDSHSVATTSAQLQQPPLRAWSAAFNLGKIRRRAQSRLTEIILTFMRNGFK